MAERAADHNPDIALDILLTSSEELLRSPRPRPWRRGSVLQRDLQLAESSIVAMRELQLWVRQLGADVLTSRTIADGIDGRLRRLEAAAAADDAAIDDLRDLIDELRIQVDRLTEHSPLADP